MPAHPLANGNGGLLVPLQGKAVIRGLLEEVAGLWQPGAPSSDLAAGREANTAHSCSRLWWLCGRLCGRGRERAGASV
jgi:hypothetical protein